MTIFLNSIKLSERQRKIIACMALIFTFTSNQVQAASATDILPVIANDETLAAPGNDVEDRPGMTVPAGALSEKAQPTAEVQAVQQVKKLIKKWNTVNAPDLITKPTVSSEAAVRTVFVASTAYTSDPRETDSSPFTTANGTQVRDGIVAANFLKFGTRIRIPEYFGDKVFEVHDRMNQRYNQRVDIWMTNKADAFKWGVRRIKIEILP